jgi:multiple antibiotic resistance protein
MLSVDDYIQAIVAVLVITDPMSRPIFFAMLTHSMTPSERRKAAIKVIVAVAFILGGAALVGKMLLDAIGIHLGAFGFTGGLIVAAMGIEMMSMGEPSKTQGGKESRDTPNPDDQLLVPFVMPFIAGPGAITIVITLSTQTGNMDSIVMALVAVGVSVLAMCFTFLFLTDYLVKIPDRAMNVITKFGGLIIATIGVQLAFSGIKSFFEIGT